MSLLEDWRKYAEDGQQAKGVKFWKQYFDQETQFYRQLLTGGDQPGTLSQCAQRFGVEPIIMMGFLDGANDSLKTPNDLESLEADSPISLDYDRELLYKNMVEAKADWLYNLPEWDPLLTQERRKELYKEQKSSKTVVKGEKIGRNDPCPCGSGEKYKKCCGRDA